MLPLPHRITSFFLQFLELLDDPELNTLLVSFYGGSISVEQPITIRVQTNHIGYHVEHDFQIQMVISQSEIRVWCCCIDLKSMYTTYFMYQYSLSSNEIILGNMQELADRMLLVFKDGYFREMLSIDTQGLSYIDEVE